jgi:hypothetical protein
MRPEAFGTLATRNCLRIKGIAPCDNLALSASSARIAVTWENAMTTRNTSYFTGARLARWGRNTACILSFGWVYPHPEPSQATIAAPEPAAVKVQK